MSTRDEDKAFESDVGFGRQREYYAEFAPARSYFMDWLSAMYWELQGACGPIEYATRVCIAREIVEKVNAEHAMSSHLMLKRVLKNLFPYDKIRDVYSPSLRTILGNQRGKVKFNKFRTLQDSCVKNPKLVELRYRIVSEAFCIEVRSIAKLLRENIDEEELPSYKNLGEQGLEKCRDTLDELIKVRQQFYLNYPPEHIRSVSNFTIKNEENLKKRSDMPKDMEPEYLCKLIAKYTTEIRNELQVILIQAKDVCSTLDTKKNAYFNEINELLIMNSTIRQYVHEGPFEEISQMVTDLGKYIEDKFDYLNYLPEDILSNLEKGYTIYKNGYL